jgi:hypothetical protein
MFGRVCTPYMWLGVGQRVLGVCAGLRRTRRYAWECVDRFLWLYRIDLMEKRPLEPNVWDIGSGPWGCPPHTTATLDCAPPIQLAFDTPLSPLSALSCLSRSFSPGAGRGTLTGPVSGKTKCVFVLSWRDGGVSGVRACGGRRGRGPWRCAAERGGAQRQPTDVSSCGAIVTPPRPSTGNRRLVGLTLREKTPVRSQQSLFTVP